MTTPILSIIVPIYNAQEYLNKTITSIMGQTLANLEILAVNDGSTDMSESLIQQLAKKDTRIKLIIKANGGYGSAINAGIAVATGKYIGIVESDDYVLANMFQTLVELADAHETDIARGSFLKFDESGTDKQEVTIGTGIGVFSLNRHPEFIVTPPAIWSAIYRRDFLINNSLRVIDTPGASYQDVDFFVRTTVLANKIICTDQCLYCYRTDNMNSSSNNGKKVMEIFDVYRQTDSFMTETNNLSDEIRAFYKKRMICDLMWHYRRIEQGSKLEFLKHAQKYLLEGGSNEISIKHLNAKQTAFFVASKYLPSIYFYCQSFKTKINE